MTDDVKLPLKFCSRLEARPRVTAEQLQQKEAAAAARAALAIANKALRAVNSRPGHTEKERKSSDRQAQAIEKVVLESAEPANEPTPWWPSESAADTPPACGESQLDLFAPSSSEQFWQETERLAIAKWPSALLQHSFRSVRVALSAVECRSMLDILDPSTRASDRRAHRETLRGVEGRIEAQIAALGGRCFVKMDSRSPKDVTFVGEISATEQRLLYLELGRLRQAAMHSPLGPSETKNAQAVAVLRACQASMLVTEGSAAVTLLLSSARVATDLRKSLKFAEDGMGVVVREFHRIAPDREFRAFVCGGKLTAMCQYFHFASMHVPPAIVEAAKKFLEEVIIPLLPISSCVIDVTVLTNGCMKVIELNPFHYTTGPCLFDWKLPQEVELLKNGPFTWRQRAEVDLQVLIPSIASQYWSAIEAYDSSFAPCPSAPTLALTASNAISAALPFSNITTTNTSASLGRTLAAVIHTTNEFSTTPRSTTGIFLVTQNATSNNSNNISSNNLTSAPSHISSSAATATTSDSTHETKLVSPSAPLSWQFVADPVALDAEGFIPAFTAAQPAALKTFFERYGFVVIRDALSVEDVAETARDIYQLAGFRACPGLEELDQATWEAVSGSRYNTKRGFLGNEPSWSEIAWKNRVNKNLYEAFSTLFERPDLLLKIDRYGLMRPTVFGEAGTKVVRPHWQTESQWLHWDQNPLEEPDFVRVQMVLAISPHLHNSGGFHCIPGAARQWQQWASANATYAQGQRGNSLVELPKEDGMRIHTQRITMRPGSAVLWDSRTPHGNFPNTSTGWRLCQYMGFHPAPTSEHDASVMKNRKFEMSNLASDHGGKRERRIPLSMLKTKLYKQMIGLEAWEGPQKPHVLGEYTLAQIGLRSDN